MLDGFEGMVEHHPRACPSHHSPHTLAHVGLIAVNGALLAGGFAFAKLASVETCLGIPEQFGTVATEHLVPLASPAIEPHHQTYHPLLLLYSAHFSHYIINIIRPSAFTNIEG